MHKSAERGQKLPAFRAEGRKGPTLRASQGFTLIEMIVVVVVLGILAMIGTNLIGTREKAYLTVMKADLKNIANEQAPHVLDNYQYANALTDLPYTPSDGISVELLGESAGFTARTTHLGLPAARCALFMGTVSSVFSPATVAGVISCDGLAGGRGGGAPQQ